MSKYMTEGLSNNVITQGFVYDGVDKALSVFYRILKEIEDGTYLNTYPATGFKHMAREDRFKIAAQLTHTAVMWECNEYLPHEHNKIKKNNKELKEQSSAGRH